MMKLFKGCAEVVDVAEKLRRVTYIHDICVRCGKTILRTDARIVPLDRSAA